MKVKESNITKYILGLFFAACIIIAGSFQVYAANYDIDAESLFQAVNGEVTGYTGDKESETQIVIPSTIGGKTVTKIGAQAFADCNALAVILIPDTITSIDTQAFARDEALSSILTYTDAEVTGMIVTKDDSVSKRDIVELPSGLTSLAADAFLTCNKIPMFRVKNSNTAFTTYTENNANGQNGNGENDDKDYNEGEFLMTKDGKTIVRYAPGNHVNGAINIPSGVTTIGAYSFESCDSTGGVVIPNTVTSIGDYGFYGYRGQLKVTFEENSTLTSIGAYAFSHLGIFDIKLPSSVTVIGDYCFEQITNIHQLDISETQITVVPAYAFANNPDLHELTMPTTLKEVRGYAFSGSRNIDTVKFLGDTLEKIESHTFEDCVTLHTIEIPEGVTAIEDSTFSGCTNLATIVLPSTVTTIGENAFKDCRTIENLVIPANVTYIANNSFEGARTDLIDTSKSDVAQRMIPTANLKKGSFVYVGALKYKLVSAVNGNKANVSVAGVKDKKITKATVPNSLTYSVGDKKFSFTVTGIEGKAFYQCSKLKTVTIGKNVTSIGSKAFYGDKKLTKITINSKKLKKVGKQAFKNTKSKLKIKVPKAKKKKYKKLLKKGGFKGKIS